jgi:hypothetical protein
LAEIGLCVRAGHCIIVVANRDAERIGRRENSCDEVSQ